MANLSCCWTDMRLQHSGALFIAFVCEMQSDSISRCPLRIHEMALSLDRGKHRKLSGY